jgi:mevalonate kinase
MPIKHCTPYGKTPPKKTNLSAMNLQVSIPSKTFILGEYLATQGEPCLIANTKPDFKLYLTPNNNVNHQGIAAHSPAGQYAQKLAHIFNEFQVCFQDPHQQPGGFGASSAQFLALYAIYQHFINQNIEPHKLLQSYWRCYCQKQGLKPSGADVVAQFMGHLSYIDRNQNRFCNLLWPFEDINFYLLRTPNKVNTHLHLRTAPPFNHLPLKNIMQAAWQALHNKDSQQMVACINDYYQALLQQQLVDPSSETLIATLMQQPWIQAAKGCGALGADVLLVITAPEYEAKLRHLASQLSLNLIASNEQLSAGITLQEIDPS